MKVYGVIMAGGGGTRFWPLSRRELPKQFLNLSGKNILVNETYDRLKQVAAAEDIFVVTNTLYAEKTLAMMEGRVEKSHILAEPAARNTAACIGYAAMEILKKYGDGIMCVMPSDHYIRDVNSYADTIGRGVTLAEEKDGLITIGIRPEYPATGYGYIRNTPVAEEDYRLVEEFVEKPEEETAAFYLAEGCYAWNSGMYIWKASRILDWFQKLLPDIYGYLAAIGNAMGTDREQQVIEEIYPKIPKISIDYGIMERAGGVLMLEGNFGWSDIGSLDALEVLHKKDAKGNVGVGSHIMMDTERTICYSENKLIAVAYVKDLIVVESKDAILICPRQRAQEVKKLVDFLEEQGKSDYL
ncbi:MAG: mannose-1-phosphate guanylyltransferase [Lachnospiraceae bacterium]|nr:mannose-1-phosphate guanylyltransferase [Lachnospiraceae bacterium]